MRATRTPARPAVIQPANHAVWLELVVERLLAELRDNGIVDPLGERFTLASVLADIFALVEAPAPGIITELIGAR